MCIKPFGRPAVPPDLGETQHSTAWLVTDDTGVTRFKFTQHPLGYWLLLDGPLRMFTFTAPESAE